MVEYRGREVGGCECGDVSLAGEHYAGCLHKTKIDPEAYEALMRERWLIKLADKTLKSRTAVVTLTRSEFVKLLRLAGYREDV